MKKVLFILLLAVLRIASRSELEKGVMVSPAGDGMSLDGYYIYYNPEYLDGESVINTYFLLNPLNNYCDDYIIRADFQHGKVYFK